MSDDDRDPHYDDGLLILGYGIVAAVVLASAVLAVVALA